ncbi:AAA family ATPase [Phocaeicola sp.]
MNVKQYLEQSRLEREKQMQELRSWNNRPNGIHSTNSGYNTPKAVVSTCKYCPQCGKELKKKLSFCPYCGYALNTKNVFEVIQSHDNEGDITNSSFNIRSYSQSARHATFSQSEDKLSLSEISEILCSFRLFLKDMVACYPNELLYAQLMKELDTLILRITETPQYHVGPEDMVIIDKQVKFAHNAIAYLEQENAEIYKDDITTLQIVLLAFYHLISPESSGEPEDIAPAKTNNDEQLNDSAPDFRQEIEALKQELRELKPTFKRSTFNSQQDYWAELDKLTGLNGVKQQLHQHIDNYKFQLERKKKHPELQIQTSFNCIFKGRPGTGKTTVARLVAGILKSEGLLQSGCCLEVDAASLISGYIGFSAKVAKLAALEAMDGVLFIDEAYALMNSKGKNYNPGDEVIDTLTPLMENYRGRLVVILAGYDKEMEEFLAQSNTGFPSRFKTVMQFEDYNADEMLSIFTKLATHEQYQLESEAVLQRLKTIFDFIYKQKNQIPTFANARTVRSVFDKVKERAATRMKQTSNADLDTLTLADVSLNKDELRSALGVF